MQTAWTSGRYISGSVICTLHQPTPELLAAPEAVHPGYGVLEVAIRLRTQREEFIQIRKADRLDIHERAGDASQLNFRPGDDSRQAETAGGSCKPLRVFGCGAQDPPPIGAQQLQTANVPCESTGTVMIFAVHVVCDCAAHRHETGSRRHR